MRSKRWRNARQLVDSQRKYGLSEGLRLALESSGARFDESVDMAVRLGVDPRHADQMVRGAVSLPHGTGKSVRVLVFAQGEAASAAEAAGADFVGSDELIQRILDGWMDFDKVVATRGMMGKVGRLGRVLGPRGLMPNPKVGTVVGDEQVAWTVDELKRGRIEFRTEKAGIIHAPIGRRSMTAEQIEENAVALVRELVRLKPSTAKGSYIRSVALSCTMGVGVRLDVNELARLGG